MFFLIGIIRQASVVGSDGTSEADDDPLALQNKTGLSIDADSCLVLKICVLVLQTVFSLPQKTVVYWLEEEELDGILKLLSPFGGDFSAFWGT